MIEKIRLQIRNQRPQISQKQLKNPQIHAINFFLLFSVIKAQHLKTFKKLLQSFVCKMSSDIPTYTLQCFSLYRRSRTFLASNALQLFQRRSGMSKRTLCIFSQDVAERPIALKVLKIYLATTQQENIYRLSDCSLRQ